MMLERMLNMKTKPQRIHHHPLSYVTSHVLHLTNLSMNCIICRIADTSNFCIICRTVDTPNFHIHLSFYYLLPLSVPTPEYQYRLDTKLI